MKTNRQKKELTYGCFRKKNSSDSVLLERKNKFQEGIWGICNVFVSFCVWLECVFIFWCLTGTTVVTFHDSLAAPTVHSGSNPRWLRPCRSAEEVPLRRNSRICAWFPQKLSDQISYQGRWFEEEDHTTPVIDKCGQCVVWLWQTVRVKMGLVSSPFP